MPLIRQVVAPCSGARSEVSCASIIFCSVVLMDNATLESCFDVRRRTEKEQNGCSGLVVEYRTRNREVAGSTNTRSTASNLEQVANLRCAQANSASYPQRDGK